MRPQAYLYLYRTELTTPDTEILKVAVGGASRRRRGLVMCVLHNKVICCSAISETESCSDEIVDVKVKDSIFVTTVDSDCQ